MPAYGDMDRAIPGLKTEGIQSVWSVRTRVAKQDIQFGKPTMGYLGDPVSCYNYALDTAKVIWDADFVTGNVIVITVNGESTGNINFDTDHATTMTAIRDAVRGLTITDSVLGDVSIDAALDPGDANNRTLYIRAKGLDVTVTESTTGGASQPAETITYQSDQVFLGVALFIQKDVISQNVAKFFVDQTVSVVEKGIVWAYVNSPVVADDDAFLDNSGGDKGNFAASGDDVNCKFRDNTYTNESTSDVIAPVEVRGIHKINAEIDFS